MKKLSLLYFLSLALLLVSCREEDALEPSYADVDRVATQLDLSNETIQRLYQDYNVGLLYEFDDTLDFIYQASTASTASSWGGVELGMIKNLFVDETGGLPADSLAHYKAYAGACATFLDTTLFRYIDPTGAIAAYLPTKVLMVESIFSESTVPGIAGDALIQSESRFTSSKKNTLRSIYNANGIAFNVNQEDLTVKTANIIRDNMFVFLCRMIDTYELYQYLPDSFFDGKSDYYGQEMEAIYREENSIDDAKYVWVIDKEWFYSKGFIDAQYFINSPSGLSTYTQYYDEDNVRLTTSIKHLKAIRPSYDFIADENYDMRSYISELLHRSSSEFEAFPANIQANLKAVLDLLEGWGVHISEINPDVEVLENV